MALIWRSRKGTLSACTSASPEPAILAVLKASGSADGDEKNLPKNATFKEHLSCI